MDNLEPGDYVLHPTIEGVRGMVMWLTKGTVYVCWETGYAPYEAHSPDELKKVNVLDLIVDGRELKFEHSDPRARCKCGVRLHRSKRRGLMICPACRLYYSKDGPVDHRPFDPDRPKAPPAGDDDGLANVRRIRRGWFKR